MRIKFLQRCHCAQGYYGLHCMQRILDCNSGSSEICGHGTCINQKNGIKCICDQVIILNELLLFKIKKQYRKMYHTF